MKNRVISVLKFFFGWPISLVALYFIYKLFATHTSVVGIVFRANLFLLGTSIFCFLTYFLLRSLFWQKLLSYKGHDYPLKESAYMWSIAELQRFVPGNIWSFVGRTHQFSAKGESKKTLVGLLTAEIGFIVSSCLILSLLSLNFLVYGLLPKFVFSQFVAQIACVGVILEVLLLIAFFMHAAKQSFVSKFFPRLTFMQTLLLLTIMTISFFFFGLGTYLSIFSFTSLYLYHILPLVGFFVFCYVVGYLSLVTPMGLGVREAIMTAGLARYIAVPQAALAALFARLITIVAELLFLGISFGWRKLYVLSLEKWIVKHRYHLILALGILLYIVYFSTASIYRYNNYYTGRFDLGNMDQTVWNTLHGRIFQLTDPDGTTVISRLAFHADFILIILAPFYLIWQDPRMLLILQTTILAFGAVFVYLLGANITKNKFVATIFALIYLLNPAIEYTNLYDFHAVTLATTFLLGAWYFMQKKQWIWYCVFFILAALTKEEIWLIGLLFGLYTALFQKKKVLGVLVAVGSLFMFYYLVWHAIPFARGGNQFALSYYSDFGSSPTGVVKNIFLSPLKIIVILFQKGRLEYLFELFFPLGFISLAFFPALIFAGPDFAVNLLSSNTQLHQLFYQYTAGITPFLFIAGLYGYSLIKNRLPRFSNAIPFLLCITTILAAYFYGPLPGAKHPNITMFTEPLIDRTVMDSFLASIPRQYSVAASNNVGSHLSHRQKIFTIPVGLKEADIVVFLLNDEFAQPSLKAQKHMAQELKGDPSYTMLFEQGPLVVFKKVSVPTYVKRKSRALLPLFK